MSASELLDAAGRRFFECAVTCGLDAMLVAPVVLLLRAVLRKRASSHLRAALPLLLVAPLVVPFVRPPTAWWPDAARSLSWRSWIVGGTEGAAAAGAVGIEGRESARRDAAENGPGRSAADELPALALRGAAAAPAAMTPASATPAGSESDPDGAFRGVASALFVAWLAVLLTAAVHWWRRSRRWRRVLDEAHALPSHELGVTTRALVRQAATRGIVVREHDRLPAPVAVGLLRPVILLPTELRRTLPDEGLRFVLLHELAHLGRGDLWADLLLRLVRLCWFFHPAPWIAGRWFERARGGVR
jgi:beta-lactamase regulating signal transducer with metallopeptidase domain